MCFSRITVIGAAPGHRFALFNIVSRLLREVAWFYSAATRSIGSR